MPSPETGAAELPDGPASWGRLSDPVYAARGRPTCRARVAAANYSDATSRGPEMQTLWRRAVAIGRTRGDVIVRRIRVETQQEREAGGREGRRGVGVDEVSG